MNAQINYIDHVFLDMDGVVTDLSQDMINEWKKEGKFQEYFIKFIKDKGFEKLGLKEDARLLLDYLISTKVKVTILSSAGNPPEDLYKEVEKQKKKWLKQHDIKFPAIVVQKKDHKKDYAKENALLIDDTLINCTEFKDAGGVAIYHGTAFSTIQLLNSEYNLIPTKTRVTKNEQ